jgi:hypothetical protein
VLQIGVGFVLISLAISLLLPLLLLSAAFVSVTWVWAAASTLALASTPAMSQAGFALWMLAQLYFLTGGGDPLKSGFIAQQVVWLLPQTVLTACNPLSCVQPMFGVLKAMR